MRWRLIFVLVALLAPAAHAGFGDWLKQQLGRSSGQGALPDAATVAAGLKQALEQGAAHAVQTLGRENGYLHHPRLRIPVPEKLAKADKTLRRLGQERIADDFVVSLNRAAEAAAPEAKAIFVEAIRGMTVEDAIGILRGPDDAATRYFRQRTEASLTQRFMPVVSAATDRVGVTRNYKQLAARAAALGSWFDVGDLDIDAYVTRKSLDGLYAMVAEEERRIRRDPVARTTELLRSVFGGRYRN